MKLLKKYKNVLIIGTIFSILTILLTIYQYKNNNYIYYWDTEGYYDSTMKLIGALNESFIETIKAILYTLMYSDYTYVPIVIPTLVMSVSGISRLIYTISITVFYTVPFIFIFLFIANSLLKDKKAKNLFIIISALACFPLLSYLSYMGYVDIGGLNIIMIIFLLSRNRKERITNNVIIGLLVMLLFFYRRWYMYYAVAFLITSFLFDLYNFIKSNNKKENLIKYTKKYLSIGIGIIVFIIVTVILNGILFNIMQKKFIDEFYIFRVLRNYKDIYDGYNKPLLEDIISIGNKFGYIIITLVITSIVIAIKNKKNIRQVLFLTFQMCICFIMFEFTQSHDTHHFLLYIINIMLLILYLFVNTNNKPINIIAIAIIIINLICYLPPINNLKCVLFFKKYGLVNNLEFTYNRNDIEEFENINNYINELSEEGYSFYINSSSSILNASMIVSYEIQKNLPPQSKYILEESNVDSRDGIPASLQKADYVLVTSPDQLHLKEGAQKIVTFINKVFLDENYKDILLPNYELANELEISGVKVYFFHRIDEITDDEYGNFASKAEEFMKN